MNTDIRIFVSYRRADSPCFAERIRDWFMLAYQRENVFMDFDAIPPFVDFEVFIVEQIIKVDVMLVIIGPRWLEMLNERMKTGETDYVRLEIRQALQLGKLVAPIVVDGASTPRADDLPEDIRAMMRANIPRLDSGRQFLDNIERIISALPKALDQHARIKAASESEADRMVDPIEAITFIPFAFPRRPSAEVTKSARKRDDQAIITDAPSQASRATEMAPPPPPPLPMPAELSTVQKPIITIYSTIEDETSAENLQASLAPMPVQFVINKAPNDSVLGIVILTPDSRNSDTLQGEIAELQKQEIPILPLLLEGDVDSSVPFAIAANQIIDMRDYNDGLETLIESITPYIN